MAKKSKEDSSIELRIMRLKFLGLLRAICQPDRDPRLRKRPADYERFRFVIGKIRNLELLMLKGHILIEESLFELILTLCVDRKALEEIQLQFSTKLRLARALGLVYPGKIYDATAMLNRLRNDMAHHGNVEDVEQRADEYLAYFTDEKPKTPRERISILRRTLALHLGYLRGILDVRMSMNHEAGKKWDV